MNDDLEALQARIKNQEKLLLLSGIAMLVEFAAIGFLFYLVHWLSSPWPYPIPFFKELSL